LFKNLLKTPQKSKGLEAFEISKPLDFLTLKINLKKKLFEM
jgi:hypothetical protein